jgi:hypothetical protein
LALSAATPPTATAAAAPAAPPCTAGTLINTENGPVCGVVANGVTSYLPTGGAA